MDLLTFKSAFRQLLSGKTSAGTRVSTRFDRRRGLPQVTFQVRGGSPWRGYHQGTAQRVQLTCWAEDESQASILFSEVRDVLLPPATPAEGYYGTVAGVNFSGAALSAGPEDLVDPPTDLPTVMSYWLISHY